VTSTPIGAKPARDFGSRAFTLIELLVVIAIIAVLASLMLPVLSKAKESAKSIVCVNNLHQIAVASAVYELDQNDRTPYFRTWLATKPGDITTGTLFPYLKTKGVYLCPSDKPAKGGPFTGIGGPVNQLRDYSYGYNCGCCHAAPTTDCHWQSKTVLFMEGKLGSNDFTGVVGPVFAPSALIFTHNNRGHLAMLDLHIETMSPINYSKVVGLKQFWFPTEDLTGEKKMVLPLNLH